MDKSLNYDKGSSLFCQIAIRKILLDEDGLTLSILVRHTFILFIINSISNTKQLNAAQYDQRHHYRGQAQRHCEDP